MRNVFIYGYGGCGKSVLLGLLDSFSEFKVCHIHDYSFSGFNRSLVGKNYVNSNLLIRDIRKALAKTAYYNFELVASEGFLYYVFSSKKGDIIKVPHDFDFYHFERSWTTRVKSYNEYDPKFISNAIYSSYMESVGLSESGGKYFTALGPSNFSLINNTLHLYPDQLAIVVYRNLENLIGTSLNRELPYDDLVGRRTKSKYHLSFSVVKRSLLTIIYYHRLFRSIRSKGMAVVLVNLDKDLFDKEGLINKIGLNGSTSWKGASFCGNTKLQIAGKDYADGMTDTGLDLLGRFNVNLINMLGWILRFPK